MAAKVMRMPTANAFPDMGLDLQTHRLRRHSVDYGSASDLRKGERFGNETLRAASRSLPSPSPLGTDTANDTVDTDPKSSPPEDASQPTTTKGTNDEVDSLVSQFETTKIETAAPNVSRVVKVPKGFELGMAFNIANFYDLRSEFRRLDKRKRDLGIIPKGTQGQKHGFRPEELLWYGAIDLKNCKASNLDNQIHPLLSPDAFDDTPDHVYDQLVPGLRLATYFLSHPACMQFWVTLAKGERRVDHEMSRRCGKTRHRIIRNAPMSKENVGEVIDYMKKLGNVKAIHFTFTSGLAFEGGAAFGVARTVCDYQSEDSDTSQHRDLQRSNIRLHSDFYIIAKKLSTMKYPNLAQKLRFNFILATLIVHELAHAIELSQWRNRAPSPYEPFLLHHNEAELGRMWESYMFGGQVTPINDRVDGIYGVATWNWPRSFGEFDPERTICYALPMKYIENLQQWETWERDYARQDWRVFHVPRDGATSIYMNSVTTVSWTEEERIAKEALQERQLQDLEGPAKKKRETADGHAVAIKESVPESEVVEPPVAEKLKDTTAQQVNRVKREPHGVLSRKQRRAQKKVEQKASEKKQAEDIPVTGGQGETPVVTVEGCSRTDETGALNESTSADDAVDANQDKVTNEGEEANV
ncbi:MAG: hypothetical protein Q9219_004401 [cf. Caloplaca sp. 3 TL-2023]